MVDKLHSFFIPQDYTLEQKVYRQARIFVNTCLLTVTFAVFYVGNCILFEMPHVMVQIMVFAALFFSLPWMFKYGVPLKILANVFSFLFFVSTIYDVYWTGGLSSGTIPWFAMVPVISMLLSDLKTALVWMILCLNAMTTIGVAQMIGVEFPVEVHPDYIRPLLLSSHLGLVGILFAVASVMEKAYLGSLQKLDDTNKLIQAEKDKSDDLLLNILPEETAAELKDKGHVDARHYNMVTVLFTDFRDFTRISQKYSPEDLVNVINSYYSAFDSIMERNGLEKIKTIGDSYMAAGGLPNSNTTNPHDVIYAAKQIAELNAKKLAEDPDNAFEIRIGVHTGPVVAGIVGVKKFAYDIWGDTVNMASRMEKHSEPGRINISQSTYEQVHSEFECEHRGEIEVKGKGALHMYFVN